MQKGSVNKVVLVGHLGGDPETRFTPSGAAVANFNLATNESWRDANGDIQDKTEWHRCVMFGKSAEMAGDLLKKGQLVFTEAKASNKELGRQGRCKTLYHRSGMRNVYHAW